MPARIALRVADFDLFMGLKGYKTDQAKADACGVDPATLSRIRKGSTAPGHHFIAGCLAALPEVGFHRLFEVVTDDDTQPGAA